MYQDIFPNEVESWLQKGAQIIDVREPDEFHQGHLPGARNIPLGVLTQHAPSLQAPVVVVCQSGGRSQMASEHLAQVLEGPVLNLMGGTLGWKRQGYRVEAP
ncbi:hypothetical protein DC3_17000 [Deinococcus cellulosilyticus NBRC 106333 = KACC 11606]|uniref:Rhodanese domain-containing protein n=2 Tax=Deinococcus cellulosilyticus TaxID=401558 RepID=A0A511MZK6_DEIC1|nr:hypothetical protein DC3_17000 [Deinococcus cellulosilyticus NBRC 106333 = KACC 11606]